MSESKRYRSAIDGQLVTKEYAEANPDTTVAETVVAGETKDDVQDIDPVDAIQPDAAPQVEHLTDDGMNT